MTPRAHRFTDTLTHNLAVAMTLLAACAGDAVVPMQTSPELVPEAVPEPLEIVIPPVPPPRPACNSIRAYVRDFRGNDETNGHPDFERYSGPPGAMMPTLGMVEPTLGAERLPVFVDRQPRTDSGPTTKFSFDQWYRDTPAVNQTFAIDLLLTDGLSDNPAFFPLDGRGFGNRSFDGGTAGPITHNFHFTTEVRVSFKYDQAKNLKFSFRGDDDLWIFVNGKLALDLGGLHEALEGTIDFNAQAATLGLVDGQEHTMDIFHAERRAIRSSFRVETNIECFTSRLL